MCTKKKLCDGLKNKNSSFCLFGILSSKKLGRMIRNHFSTFLLSNTHLVSYS